jgi:membrane protein implicated in regulation of membrane protease activity
MRPVRPEYFWLILGVVLLTMEVLTPGFVIFFFGVAAVLVGVICWLAKPSDAWQMILFAGLSVVLLLTLRRRARAVLAGRRRNGGEGIDDACVGRRAVVTAPVGPPPREGRVELGGTGWNAVADEALEPGAVVVVTARDGLTLTVRRLRENDLQGKG